MVEKTIDSGFTEYAPGKLIADKAHDSDELDQRLLNDRNIEMIAPHRKGRKRPKTQDGRKLKALVGVDGRWSGFLPGFRIPGDLWFDTNITLIISLAWSSLDAP